MDSEKVIAIDIDGCLTDQKAWFTQDGQRIKSFNTYDLSAIKELQARGFEVWLITASSWPGNESFQKKTGAGLVVARDKMEALPVFKNQPFIFIGDSRFDIEIMKNANRSFCPADAEIDNLKIPNCHRLRTKGGEGVLNEVMNYL